MLSPPELPGLVFQPYVDELLENAAEYRGCSKVSILENRKSSAPTWVSDLDTKALRDWLASESQQEQLPIESNDFSIRIFFISGRVFPDTYTLHLDPETLAVLRSHAGMSDRFVSDVYSTEAWTKLDMSSTTSPNTTMMTLNYGFWAWDEPTSSHSFVSCNTTYDATTYFCVNFPERFIRRIVKTFEMEPPLAHKLFLVDVLITDELMRCCRRAIEMRNSGLICIECETDRSSIEDRTTSLHSLSVDWHTICKDLHDLEEQISHFLRLYDTSVSGLCKNEILAGTDELQGCDESLRRLQAQCQFYQRWAQCYRDRTASRINLIHHLATQQDNRLTQQINDYSAQVALQTQRDGASMFTIAVVTAIFLPGTFVSSVLSTVFFSYDGNALSVSSWWWTLPVTAVPLTIAVVYLWFVWYRARLSRDRALLEAKRQELETSALSRTRSRPKS